MPYSYANITCLPIEERLNHLQKKEKLYHIIFAKQFERATLEHLCSLATQTRRIAKASGGKEFLRSLLPHRSAMMYFTQPSTRTYLSFVRACQHLGMSYADVRDPRISSAMKGESDIDGVRTFSSYFDLMVMRHAEAGFAERVAYMMNEIDRKLPVVSGGAGPDEHPTQALLDIYTLARSFEERRRGDGIDGIHIAFVGDVKRGRTVRSLARLLMRYEAVRMTFVAPEALRIKQDLKDDFARAKVEYIETESLDDVIREVDAIYMTRIQDEYDEPGAEPVDYSKFALDLEMVETMKKDAIVMHPLPRRGELDPAIDFNPRAMYWRQERNGMWIRAALIAYLFNVEARILDYHAKHFTRPA